jgi:hypothetical protein
MKQQGDSVPGSAHAEALTLRPPGRKELIAKERTEKQSAAGEPPSTIVFRRCGNERAPICTRVTRPN